MIPIGKLWLVALTATTVFMPQLGRAQTPPFLLKWGTPGTGDGQFLDLRGIAVDRSGNDYVANVYVADRANDRIQKFTSFGNFLMKWGSSGAGDGQFSSPVGVAVDGAGNVYVADTGNHRIQKFTSMGGFLTKWGSLGAGDGQFANPTGVDVDAGGNVYVADYSNHRIQKFTSTGGFLTKWGTLGAGDGEFNFPYGVAADGSGNVYVVEASNNRIQKFASAGGFLLKWGSPGAGDGQFASPAGVAVDRAGNVYVADTGNHRIQQFTSTGGFVTKWGTLGTGNGQFDSPYDVAVDRICNTYVTDSGNYRIQRFDTACPIDSTHFWTYTLIPPRDTMIAISARDQFLPFQPLLLDTLARLVNWVKKNRSPVRDSALHFTWWDIMNKIPVRKVAHIRNQFGTTYARLDHLEFLLAPAAKNDTAGPPSDLSHYLCYRAFPLPGPRGSYTLLDEWRADTLAVDSLKYFCAPCLKYNNGIYYPPPDSMTHLAVYRIDPISEPFLPIVEDQFDSARYVVQQVPHEYLLVPSHKTYVTAVEMNDASPEQLFAAPNPGPGRSAVYFALATAARVSVDVIDIAGRRVATLAREQQFGAGRHTLVWDGRSSSGIALSAGIYFVQLRSEGRMEVVRVALQR